MREIIFRGKEKDTPYGPLWRYGDLTHNFNAVLVAGHVVDDETVGQYTGRCAGESKKIFEGDVLEYTVFDYQGQDLQYRGVVEWSGSRFIVSVHSVFACNSWRPRRDYEEEYYDLDWMLDQDDEVKIIANVYDNPGLLKEGDGYNDK